MIIREGLVAFALVILLLIGAGGWGQLGLWLLERLRPDRKFIASRWERRYFALVLGVGILSWLTLFLGLARLFYTATAVALISLGWIVGLILLRKGPEGPVADAADAPAKERGWLRRVFAICLLILGAGSLLYSLLAHTLMPPHEWDEIAYHMALAKLYVDAHGIIYVPFIVHSNWPMNTEMLFSLGLLLGSDVAAHFITWFMSLGTATGLYLLGKRFFDRRVGLLAAVLYLTVPLIKRLSGTGLIDVSLAFYGTAALFAYAHYRRERSLPWVGLAGLFAGLAAGSKLMGGAYPLLLGVLIALDALRGPRLTWRSFLTRAGLFGALGLLMVGPWYARSYAFTGNPIWPFLFQIFGGRNWDALGHEYHMQSLLEIWTVDLSPTLGGLVNSFYYLFFEPERLGGYPGGLGRVLLTLVALAVLWLPALRRIPRLMYELLLFCGLYYAIWFLVVSPQVRFLIPILPALTLIGAFTFYHLWDLLPRPWLRWIPAGLLLLFLIRDFPWVDAAQRNLALSRWPYLSGQRTREDFLQEQIDVYPAFQYINANLPPQATILLLPYESRGYYLERSYFWGHPISQRVIRFEEYDGPDRLAADLRKLGITHILDNPHWLYSGLRYWEHDRALMLALESQCGEEIASWGDIILYRLTECDGGLPQ